MKHMTQRLEMTILQEMGGIIMQVTIMIIEIITLLDRILMISIKGTTMSLHKVLGVLHLHHQLIGVGEV
jgi:hypothetical protein